MKVFKNDDGNFDVIFRMGNSFRLFLMSSGAFKPNGVCQYIKDLGTGTDAEMSVAGDRKELGHSYIPFGILRTVISILEHQTELLQVSSEDVETPLVEKSDSKAPDAVKEDEDGEYGINQM